MTDRYRDDRYQDRDGYYGGNDGYRDNRGNEANRTVATVIGGIAGAVLGSKIGDGSGRYVGTAVGSMVGGMAGRSIYDSSQRNRQLERRGTVRVCDPVPVTSRDGYYDDDETAVRLRRDLRIRQPHLSHAYQLPPRRSHPGAGGCAGGISSIASGNRSRSRMTAPCFIWVSYRQDWARFHIAKVAMPI